MFVHYNNIHALLVHDIYNWNDEVLQQVEFVKEATKNYIKEENYNRKIKIKVFLK